MSPACSYLTQSLVLTLSGVVYIFAGSILLDGNFFRYTIGSVIGLIGVAYVALEFVPSIEPPQNMRDANEGYEGPGEQV